MRNTSKACSEIRKRIFLVGTPGCGKSTLIKNVLGEKFKEAAGFITLRKPDGFALCAPGEDDGEYFLRFGENNERNDDVFKTAAVEYLKSAANKHFAVIDETGGLELEINEFSEELEKFLESGTPCIGVIKSSEGFALMKKRVNGIDESSNVMLLEKLKHDKDTKVIEVLYPGDENVRRELELWAGEYT